MKKITCDRCGKESTGEDMFSHWIDKPGGGHDIFDLCEECDDKYGKLVDELLIEFIKEG